MEGESLDFNFYYKVTGVPRQKPFSPITPGEPTKRRRRIKTSMEVFNSADPNRKFKFYCGVTLKGHGQVERWRRALKGVVNKFALCEVVGQNNCRHIGNTHINALVECVARGYFVERSGLVAQAHDKLKKMVQVVADRAMVPDDYFIMELQRAPDAMVQSNHFEYGESGPAAHGGWFDPHEPDVDPSVELVEATSDEPGTDSSYDSS